MSVSIEEQISATINQVLTQSGRPSRTFAADETLLGDIGLDSLDLAEVVVTLEQKLGVDPFRQGAAGVRTFGDFVQSYSRAVGA